MSVAAARGSSGEKAAEEEGELDTLLQQLSDARYEVLNKLEEETHHHDYHHEDNYQSLIEEEEEEEMITLAAEDVDNFEEETTTTTNIEQQKTVTKHEIEIRVRDAMDADEGGGSEASMSSRQPSGLNGVRSLIVQPTMSSPLPEMEQTLKDSSQRRTFVTSIEKEIPARRYNSEWRDNTDSAAHEVKNCAASRLMMPVAVAVPESDASSSVGDRSSFVSTSTTSGEETHVEEERVVTRTRTLNIKTTAAAATSEAISMTPTTTVVLPPGANLPPPPPLRSMIPVATAEYPPSVNHHDYSSSESEIGCLRHNLHEYNDAYGGGVGGADHIPVNTDIAVEFREYVERLEKLSLHPAEQTDFGAADEGAAAGTLLQDQPGTVLVEFYNCSEPTVQRPNYVCAACHAEIEGRCITAMHRKFHPEHFVCSYCLKQLNSGTFKEASEKPYCRDCFIRLYG